MIARLKLDSGEYDSKIKRATQGLLQMENECRKVGGTLAVLEKEQLDFVKGLGQMQTVSQGVRGKLGELTSAYTELAVQYKRLTDEEKKGDFGKALNASLQQLKGRINETKTQLADVNKELSGSKFGQFGGVIDTIGQKMGITGNLTEMLTSKTAMLTAGIGASVAIIGKATEAWASYNSELAKQDQITTVTTGLKGEDANKMTDFARSLVDTYNVDFREAINAANTLMTQFGQTGDEAIQLLRDGMQGMIQGDGGKLLSMIKQYAPAFRDAGVSASQLIAVIQNSEGGIFTDQNMNAIVMGIKNIRLMTKPTSDALAQLGIDGQKMSQQLSDGTLTIFDALKQVATAIQGVDSNSKAAGEVMQQVFGRQGAMAGTKLGEAIATLNTNLEETKRQTGEVGDALADLQTANERLNTAIREAFGYDGWEQMATGIKTKLIGALADVIEHLAIIEEGFGKISKFFGGGGNKPSGIGYKDVEDAQTWINNGKDDNERRSRYDKIIANLQKKLNNVGKEYSRKNADGSTSYVIDDEETQAKKRAAIQKRMKMLYATSRTEETPIKPIKPIPGSGGGKGGNKNDIKYASDSIMAQKKLVQELTQEWETASGTMREGVLKRLDEAKAKLTEMTAVKTDPGSLKDYQQQLKKTSDEITTTREEILRMKATGADPMEISAKEDSLKAAVNKLDDIQKKVDYLNGKEISLDIVINGEGNTDMGETMVTDLQDSLINAADNLDLTEFTEKWQDAMANGAEEADYSEYFENMRKSLGDAIDNEEWPKIKLAIETGDIGAIEKFQKKIQDSSKKTEKGWKDAAGSIGQLGSALQKIEDPGVKAVGTVVEAVASAALGFAQASKGPFTNPWEWIAFAASGLATMITMITTIHQATEMANGGIVKAANGAFIPGNNYSGDNVFAGNAWVNSGELVLNRAQQGNLAEQLEDSRNNAVSNSHPYVSGEMIYLGVNNYLKRSGRGEIITSRG